MELIFRKAKDQEIEDAQAYAHKNKNKKSLWGDRDDLIMLNLSAKPNIEGKR